MDTNIIAITQNRVYAEKLRIALWNEGGNIDARIMTGQQVRDTIFEYQIVFSDNQKTTRAQKMNAREFARGFLAACKYI